MEKNNKTKIVAVISSLILLLLVIGASFAYFGSFETNLNNNVAVNIITASPGNATFISNATFLDLNVSASKMDLMNSDDNTPALTNEANLIISLTSGSDSLKTTCTYDIIYEYDYNSKVYGAGEEVVTSGATKEITLEVKGNGGTNNYSEEKNFNYDSLWTAKDDTNKKGPKKVLVSSVTIENSSANTPTVQNFTFTGRYYNLSLNQKQLINKSFTGKIYAESKGCVTKEVTASDKILANNGGAESIEAKGTPTFTTVATTNEGMYATEDDYTATTGMKSYYFRGAVDNNWLKFGEVDGKPIYWRIIRINGDGSIRLIYTGTTAPTESQKVVMTGTGTQISTSKFNSSYNSSEYVGYKYEIGKQHGLANDSTIKLALENWYKTTTLYTNETTSKLVADTPFCYDRTASTSDNGTYGEISNWSSTGTPYYYGSYGRTSGNNTGPSLKCTNELDKYSVANRTLSYPVGLITADEIVLAGAEMYGGNSSYYLYTGQSYWSGSPSAFIGNDGGSLVFNVVSGNFVINSVNDSYGVRSAISLSSEAKLSGDGTWNNPYTVD